MRAAAAVTATAYVFSDIFQMLPRRFNRETVQGSYARLNSEHKQEQYQ